MARSSLDCPTGALARKLARRDFCSRSGKPSSNASASPPRRGRLSLEELVGRTEAAYSATTRGELANVALDLPEQDSLPSTTQPVHSQRMVSVFADVSRRGWWRAEGTVSPTTVFGDVELDLREAAVPTGQVQMSAVAPFGDIEVIVPDGVIVELTGFSLFGRKKVDVRRSSSMRSAPVVRVQGFIVFGSVLVRS